MPARITIGRGLASGVVEVLDRRRRETSETPVDAAVARVKEILARAGGA